MHKQQRFRASVWLALVVAAGLDPALAPRLRAQAAERQMYVSVVDSNGAPVKGLGPTDFVIREDGRLREVLRVTPAVEPMQIALLVDTGQDATDVMIYLRTALPAFIDRLAGQNQIALITFGERPTIRIDYTSDGAKLRASAAGLFASPGSGAYALDAIVETVRGIKKREASRPVIVLVGIEGTEYSRQYYQQVQDEIVSTGAPFHAVMVRALRGGEIPSDEVRNRDLLVDTGTRASGGRRELLLTGQALEPKLKQLADELASQYMVTYARPDSLIPPERIEVAATKPGLTARGTPVKVPGGR